MLFTSYSGTLWWYSNKSRIDFYPVQMEGVHLSQRNFVEFSIHFGEWIDSGRKREWQGPTISLLYSPESTRKKKNLILITLLLGILDKIVKSAGSREIALIEWLLRTEIEYFSNDSQHQSQRPKSRWRVIGKHSSRISLSSLISRMTFGASGNSVLPGKAEPECKTIRNTPRK